MAFLAIAGVTLAAASLVSSIINTVASSRKAKMERKQAGKQAKTAKKRVKSDIERVEDRRKTALKRFGEFATGERQSLREIHGGTGLAGRTHLHQRQFLNKQLRRQRSDIKTQYDDTIRSMNRGKKDISSRLDYLSELEGDWFTKWFAPGTSFLGAGAQFSMDIAKMDQAGWFKTSPNDTLNKAYYSGFTPGQGPGGPTAYGG